MYFNKLLLKDFGKFNNREIELKSGLNLIYGENESGKTTVKEFIVGMLYGIDKSRGIGARMDNYELRKPLDGRGFSGKAYLKDKDKTYLVERSFLRYSRKVSMMNIQTGQDVRLKNKNSLNGTLFDMDKNTYVNTLCIGEHGAAPGKELANEMNNYLANLTTTGSADIDREKAIELLKAEKKKNDTRQIQSKLDEISENISSYEDVDEKLDKVRGQIAELDEEFATETARRKREARRLIETDKGVSYEENDELTEDLDNLAKSSVFLNAELAEDFMPPKKLTDRLWFILLTGIFVVLVVAAMVYILPFSNAVRQLFIVFTAMFVIIVIVEGLYTKGVFDGDEIYTPSEEDFKRMIYELERKTEIYEEVEIDMSFAKDYADKKAVLRMEEKEYLDQKERKRQLKDEYNTFAAQLKKLEYEIRAIDLAIDTINDVSARIHSDLGFLINDNISDIVSRITDGKYQDVKMDENMHIMVKDNDSYVGIEYLSAGTMEQIYLAVRLSVARYICRDEMPLIIDDIFTNYDEKRLVNTLDCLKTIQTKQIILLTSNSHIGDMLDDLDMDYNYVEL